MQTKTCAQATHDVQRAIEGALAADALQALKAAIAMVEFQMQSITVRVPLEPRDRA